MKSVFFFVCILCIANKSFGQLSQIGQDIDGIAGDQTGHSVDLNEDGSVVVIGGPFNDDIGSRNGVVRVYEFNGTNWTQKGQDLYGIVQEVFGHSVAINDSGNRIFVSSLVVNNVQEGSVYCYDFNGTSWVQLGQTIHAEHPGEHDLFGYSLATNASGSRFVAGASWDDDGNTAPGSNAGSARVFEFNGTNWVQMGQDLDGPDENGVQFGTSVTMDDSGLFIGVGGSFGQSVNSPPGVVRVYSYNSTTSQWDQRGPDIIGDETSDKFGNSISIGLDGGQIAISAPLRGANNQGAVKVFTFGAGIWTQYGQTIVGASQDGLGTGLESLAMDKFGTKLVIGSKGINGSGLSSGQARIYSFDNGNLSWQQIGTINGEAAGDQMCQVSMSDDGQRIALGAIKNSGGGTLSGHTRVYGLGTLNNENYNLGENLVYPNPNNGTFQILNNEKISYVEAFDILGRKVDIIFNKPDGEIVIAKGKGVFYLKISFENLLSSTVKIEVF